MTHRHLITGVNPRPPFICECGLEMDSKDRWVEPKSPEGKARREAWMKETAE